MIRKREGYILIAILAAVAVSTFDWAIKGAIHYKKDVLFPDLTGKSLNEALDLLTKSNLGLRKDGAESNDQVPAGTVLRQSPTSGSQVREGKIVRIVVSQGGETVFIPDLAGQSLRSAEINLRSNFLSLGEVRSQPSLKFEKDMVIFQEPAPRAVARKNALVHITVSDGPPQDGTLLMPDLVGKTREDALAWAKASGITLDVGEDPNSAAPQETIAQQDRPADAVVTPHGTVKLTVSTNPSGAVAPGQSGNAATFHFEVPQGEASKQYSFVLVDSFGSREVLKGSLQPGSKHDIALPTKMGSSPRVRIFVDGILTEERPLQ